MPYLDPLNAPMDPLIEQALSVRVQLEVSEPARAALAERGWDPNALVADVEGARLAAIRARTTAGRAGVAVKAASEDAAALRADTVAWIGDLRAALAAVRSATPAAVGYLQPLVPTVRAKSAVLRELSALVPRLEEQRAALGHPAFVGPVIDRGQALLVRAVDGDRATHVATLAGLAATEARVRDVAHLRATLRVVRRLWEAARRDPHRYPSLDLRIGAAAVHRWRIGARAATPPVTDQTAGASDGAASAPSEALEPTPAPGVEAVVPSSEVPPASTDACDVAARVVWREGEVELTVVNPLDEG
jgi:hypothetical protein